MKILLIGNSGIKHNSKDGQTSKVRLYLKKMKDEGVDVNFVDLENFAKRPLSSLLKIKKGMKWCDRVVLITAERGCRILIPYINEINKKENKPFVLPLVGTNVLHQIIDKLTNEEQYDFIVNRNYSLSNYDCTKLKKELSKITYILPETDLLSTIFREYFDLKNVVTLNNFRENQDIVFNDEKHDKINLIFLSRVMAKKGIFDLLESVKRINSSSQLLNLDIYGGLSLNDCEKKRFDMYLCDTIKYCGAIDNRDTINVISKYDLFVFPTQFPFEGTPGVIVESFLAGVPVLSSNFPQVNSLMNNGVDSILYKMFDKQDLEKKLAAISRDKEKLEEMRTLAKKNGERFTYNHERDLFLKYVCGL